MLKGKSLEYSEEDKVPASRPEVSSAVTQGGTELSAPQGRALTAGGESHLHPPPLPPSPPPPPLPPVLQRRSESWEWKVRTESCFSPTLHHRPLNTTPKNLWTSVRGGRCWSVIHVFTPDMINGDPERKQWEEASPPVHHWQHKEQTAERSKVTKTTAQPQRLGSAWKSLWKPKEKWKKWRDRCHYHTVDVQYVH